MGTSSVLLGHLVSLLCPKSIPQFLRDSGPQALRGEYLDFHPHLHALVADGLFARSGLFYCLPNVSLKPLEEIFWARAPPEIVDRVIEPCFDDPFPDYDTEPVMMYANG